jgi:general secretion pathway protein G
MKRNAFTLIELLIIVIILGILAAVVIPQFSDASTDARLSSLQENLTSMRKQIDLYKLHHNGSLPTVTNFVDQMTQKTDADGTVNASGKFGPYVQRIPINPFTVGGSGNDVTSGAAAANKAWYFNETTGEFKANNGGSTNGVNHDSY